MMIRTLIVALVGLVIAGGCTPRRTVVAEAGDIAIADAYATVSAAPEMSSVYFTVLNRGSAPDTLLTVRSIGAAELHTMVTTNGLSSMVPVPALPIPGDSCVTLKPGSYHVMLHGLPTPLAAGDTIDVSLAMSRVGTVDLRVPVLTYTEVVERLDAVGGDCR